jgi:hypothetical protein
METTASGGTYSASIPREYTASAFSLQYYFALNRGKEAAWMYPGFNATLSNQPYFTIEQRA